MRQDFFICNDTKYSSGTMIRINHLNCITYKLNIVEAKFISYDTCTDEYEIEIDNDIFKYESKRFYRLLCGIVGNNINNGTFVCQDKSKLTFSKELEIDGLFLAWIWYIFIMLVAIIFKDVILIWILASYIFFDYRKNKLKEAGYK